MDYACYPYPSRRMVTFGAKGMVATSQQLAAQAGLDMLKAGGNAIDAAIATAACLTVVEPCSNGIGSDAFAILWVKDRLYGLNSSGCAPALLTTEAVKKAGCGSMPRRGLIPVTVPGAPAAWAALSERFGKLPLSKTLAPAIRYAEEGFAVSPVVSRLWREAAEQVFLPYRREPAYAPWYDAFTQNGRAPQAGELVKLPGHAKTLRLIAMTGAKAFYEGELAERADAFFCEMGGYLRKEDLAAHRVQWVEPLGVDYRGLTVWELPPNGQGMGALIGLNLLKGFEMPPRDDARSWHLAIEALKLGQTDIQHHGADPRYMKVRPADLLEEAYARERRGLITDRALLPEHGTPARGGTVYLCTADEEGNMVSFIQSNFNGFGSGIVVPGTGIALQNRGVGFSLDPESPNCLAPGKRPFHTIIPGFLTKDGEPLGPFGVMGGAMQPQGHLQVVVNLVDYRLNPQAALDCPRWLWNGGKKVSVEHGLPEHIVLALAEMGHEIEYSSDFTQFGRGQMILRTPNGVLSGATDPRADGAVAAW